MSAWAQAAWIVKKMQIPNLILQYQDRYNTLTDKIVATNNEIESFKNKIKTFSALPTTVTTLLENNTTYTEIRPDVSNYDPSNYIDGAIWLILQEENNDNNG